LYAGWRFFVDRNEIKLGREIHLTEAQGCYFGTGKEFNPSHLTERPFVSTVLLYNDVPMEIVSELLGHSSIKTTLASYGKIVQRRLSLEMERLKKEIK
jgi:integrase